MGKSKTKHVVNWNYIATIVGVIALVITLINYLDDKKSSTQESTIDFQILKIQDYKDSIEILKTEIIENPHEEFNKVVGFYENRIRVNNMIFQDSLFNLKNKLSNGITLSKSEFDTIKLVVSYGAQALDELDLCDKRINNQKAQIKLLEELVKTQESIINLIPRRSVLEKSK